jgi:membrane protein DedA with SNARE-associated domain
LGVVLLLLASSLVSIGSGSALAQSAAGPEQPPTSEAAAHHGGHAQALDARAHRIAKDIAQDIERVEPYLERYGYWAVFAAVGIEGIGIPAPGQTLLEAGALVATVPDGKLHIGWLLFVTILATSLGQTVGYLIGRTGGRAVLDRMPIPAHSLKKVDDAFNRFGVWLVFFGRFVDGPRQLIGVFSGALAMHWGRFMLLNIGGAILWASFWALGVYYLDLHFDAVVTALRQLNPWVAGLTVVGVIALLVFGLIALFRRRGG